MGFEKQLIKLADEARIQNNYSESLNWYKKIAKKDNEYSPYAYLAIGEILSNEIDYKSYDVAYDAFKKAVDLSDNIDILNSTLNFVLQQIKLIQSEPEGNAINMLSNDNVDFVTNLLNKINSISPKQFEFIDVVFPLTAESTQDFFNQDGKIKQYYYKWEYISTLTSYNGNEAFVGDEEKLVLVDQWQELVSTSSFSTVTVYKYYRYKKVVFYEELTPLEVLQRTYSINDRYFIKDFVEKNQPEFTLE